MKQYFLHIFLPTLAMMLLLGCHSYPTDVKQVQQLPAIWPDYTEVTIPTNIAPLNFAMADNDVKTIDVMVKGSKTGELHVNGDYADFDVDEWHQLLEANKGGKLTFTVCAEKNGEWTQYLDFQVFVSEDEMDAWGITYRRIPPSYEIFSKMGIYQRCLSNFEETALIENTQIPGMCINCHTANRTNPDQYVWHVRGQQSRGTKNSYRLVMTASAGRWSIPIGIRTDAIVPSPPIRRRRCSIQQAENALRFTTASRMSLSMTRKHIPFSRIHLP